MTGRPRVLITGGSYGLGLAMAKHFIARTYWVLATGRRAVRFAAAQKEAPGLAILASDVTKPEDRARMLAAATEGGPLDILVNNAAVCHAHDYTNPFTLSADRAREEIETNFAAPIEITRLFLDQRRRAGIERRPAIIANIGTPGALFALAANPLYSASKSGFHMFTRALRTHLRGSAVHVVEVFPPALDTGLADELDVPDQAANGPQVIDACARRTVEGILAREAVVYCHPDAEALVNAIGGGIEAVEEAANIRVTRRAGWDRA